MKLLRFHYRSLGRLVSYGYIKANWFERRAIRKRMKERGERNGVVESAKAFGPKSYRAQFIIGAKPVSNQRRSKERLGI